MLELDLTKSTFIRNKDGSYTVYQLINNGYMKFPNVCIQFTAEAFPSKETGESWVWIDGDDWFDENDTYFPSLWAKIKYKIQTFLARRR